jgi:hypothetical protein
MGRPDSTNELAVRKPRLSRVNHYSEVSRVNHSGLCRIGCSGLCWVSSFGSRQVGYFESRRVGYSGLRQFRYPWLHRVSDHSGPCWVSCPRYGCAELATTLGCVGLAVPGCTGLVTTLGRARLALLGCANLLSVPTASLPLVQNDETSLCPAPICAPPSFDFLTTSPSTEYPGPTISLPVILLTLAR